MKTFAFPIQRIGMSVCAAMICACGAASAQQGQWAVTNLHPAGATRSTASAVNASGQAGLATINGKNQAMLWQGSPNAFVNLTPAGAIEAWVLGVFDDVQAGVVVVPGGQSHAAMWRGSAASMIDLNPPGADASSATCAWGTQQGGSWTDTAGPHACIWNGSPQSVIDLTLAGEHVYGNVNGLDGEQQGGRAYQSANGHPALWRGTPSSMIALDPAPVSNVISGIVSSVSGGQQVGYLNLQDKRAVHAALWTGTPESWVDLHPAGKQDSQALGVYAERQVGIVRGDIWSNQDWHATLWTGSAASRVDLHQFLPASFSSSYAYAIWSDNAAIQVVGQGFNASTSRYEALLWTFTFDHCTADFNSDGFVEFTDFDAFVAAFESGDAASDMNGDGFLDATDFDVFVNTFEAGC